MLVEIAANRCPPARGDSPGTLLVLTSATPGTTDRWPVGPQSFVLFDQARRVIPQAWLAPEGSDGSQGGQACDMISHHSDPGSATGCVEGCAEEIGTSSRSHCGRHAWSVCPPSRGGARCPGACLPKAFDRRAGRTDTTHVLFVVIPAAWLSLAIVLVCLCRAAARGDRALSPARRKSRIHLHGSRWTLFRPARGAPRHHPAVTRRCSANERVESLDGRPLVPGGCSGQRGRFSSFPHSALERARGRLPRVSSRPLSRRAG